MLLTHCTAWMCSALAMLCRHVKGLRGGCEVHIARGGCKHLHLMQSISLCVVIVHMSCRASTSGRQSLLASAMLPTPRASSASTVQLSQGMRKSSASQAETPTELGASHYLAHPQEPPPVAATASAAAASEAAPEAGDVLSDAQPGKSVALFDAKPLDAGQAGTVVTVDDTVAGSGAAPCSSAANLARVSANADSAADAAAGDAAPAGDAAQQTRHAADNAAANMPAAVADAGKPGDDGTMSDQAAAAPASAQSASAKRGALAKALMGSRSARPSAPADAEPDVPAAVQVDATSERNSAPAAPVVDAAIADVSPFENRAVAAKPKASGLRFRSPGKPDRFLWQNGGASAERAAQPGISARARADAAQRDAAAGGDTQSDGAAVAAPAPHDLTDSPEKGGAAHQHAQRSQRQQPEVEMVDVEWATHQNHAHNDTDMERGDVEPDIPTASEHGTTAPASGERNTGDASDGSDFDIAAEASDTDGSGTSPEDEGPEAAGAAFDTSAPAPRPDGKPDRVDKRKAAKASKRRANAQRGAGDPVDTPVCKVDMAGMRERRAAARRAAADRKVAGMAAGAFKAATLQVRASVLWQIFMLWCIVVGIFKMQGSRDCTRHRLQGQIVTAAVAGAKPALAAITGVPNGVYWADLQRLWSYTRLACSQSSDVLLNALLWQGSERAAAAMAC